jgi:splicing factor U2AF subunit
VLIKIFSRVFCTFYSKTGACRHGDKCTRIHNKPVMSQTLIFQNMYINPPVAIAIAEGNKVSDEALKEAIKHFEDFYEEVFLELTKYGEIKDLNVCDNLGDHLIGNVYVQFATFEEAETALKTMNGRYYSEKPITGEYSPVTDFRNSCCKDYESGSCGSKYKNKF